MTRRKIFKTLIITVTALFAVLVTKLIRREQGSYRKFAADSRNIFELRQRGDFESDFSKLYE